MRNAALAVAALVLLTACTGILPKPFTSPAQGGPPWTEVVTPHFVLATDHDRETALQVAADLERIYSTVSDLLFESADPGTKVEVVFFRRSREMEEVTKRRGIRAAGFFLGGRQRHDFEPERMVVLSGQLDNASRRLVQHELCHFFVAYYYPQASLWLNEGLAKYVEAIRLENGFAVLGSLPPSPRFHKAPWAIDCPPEGCVAYVPVADATPVTELLGMGHDEFHGDATAERGSAAEENARRLQTTHYASAFRLVRLLKEDPTFSPLFADYLARLHSGEKSVRAWRATVGRIPPSQLEAAYRASLIAVTLTVRRIPYRPVARPAERERQLTEAETRLYWARLWDWSDERGRAGAKAELDAISPAEQSHIEVVLARAHWLHASGESTAARGVLARALASQPGDPRLLTALGWVTLKGDQDDDTIRIALADLEVKLAPKARTAGQLEMLGHGSLVRGKPDESLAYLRRALAVDSSCLGCLSGAAAAFAAKGQLQDALAVAQLAEGLLQDGARSRVASQQVREYEQRLTQLAAPGPPCKELALPGDQPRGRLAPGAVRTVLAGQRTGLATCYDAGRARDPALAGALTIRFTVGADGKVSDVQAGCSSLPDAEVVACVVNSFRGPVFPAPEGGPLSLTVPVRFAP